MFPKKIVLQEGALFISDAHYSHERGELLDFIEAIHTKIFRPTQLILMGDIFDALFGGIRATYSENQKMLSLLNAISQDIELIYLEGNHDFNLQKLLPNAKVFSIQEQPVEALFFDKKLYLAHGDFDGDIFYRLYTSFIRNSLVLSFLETIDTILAHSILKNLRKYLAKKDDCKEFSSFCDFIKERLRGRFVCDSFIEGHFHQNRSCNIDGFEYINLSAFACNQSYFIIKYQNSNTVLVEQKFSRGK